MAVSAARHSLPLATLSAARHALCCALLKASRAAACATARRFDEIKEINSLLQSGEIDGPDLVARSRYCFGREFEGMHEEYLKILRKAGFKLR